MPSSGARGWGAGMGQRHVVGKETPAMRRLSLSTKLFAAALPLVIAVGALLTLTVRSDLDEVHHAERGADLGKTWTPLVASINSIEAELDAIPPHAVAKADGGTVQVDPAVSAKLTELQRAT